VADSDEPENRMSVGSYVDEKGRTRWQGNDQLAERLKQLYDFLIIGDYEESHAARYPRLAHAISRYPESLEAMRREGRLEEIPGVSGKIAGMLCELMDTGTCSKMEIGDEFFTPPPKSVLELTAVPRLGAKTAKRLYQEYGIDSLAVLASRAGDGSLNEIAGIGPSLIASILEHHESRK
jgi:DNA polymerase (family 10)